MAQNLIYNVLQWKRHHPSLSTLLCGHTALYNPRRLALGSGVLDDFGLLPAINVVDVVALDELGAPVDVVRVEVEAVANGGAREALPGGGQRVLVVDVVVQ